MTKRTETNAVSPAPSSLPVESKESLYRAALSETYYRFFEIQSLANLLDRLMGDEVPDAETVDDIRRVLRKLAADCERYGVASDPDEVDANREDSRFPVRQDSMGS